MGAGIAYLPNTTSRFVVSKIAGVRFGLAHAHGLTLVTPVPKLGSEHFDGFVYSLTTEISQPYSSHICDVSVYRERDSSCRLKHDECLWVASRLNEKSFLVTPGCPLPSFSLHLSSHCRLLSTQINLNHPLRIRRRVTK